MALDNTEFTLFYCVAHDCGCLIKGSHEFTPQGYTMAHATNCDKADWYNMGTISYDGVDVNIIKQVRINYDNYGGYYQFNMFTDDITDDVGNSIIMHEETPLMKWFESVYNYSKIFGDVIYYI